MNELLDLSPPPFRKEECDCCTVEWGTRECPGHHRTLFMQWDLSFEKWGGSEVQLEISGLDKNWRMPCEEWFTLVMFGQRMKNFCYVGWSHSYFKSVLEKLDCLLWQNEGQKEEVWEDYRLQHIIKTFAAWLQIEQGTSGNSELINIEHSSVE